MDKRCLLFPDSSADDVSAARKDLKRLFPRDKIQTKMAEEASNFFL